MEKNKTQLSLESSNVTVIDTDLEHYNASDAFSTTNSVIQPNFEFSNVVHHSADFSNLSFGVDFEL